MKRPSNASLMPTMEYVNVPHAKVVEDGKGKFLFDCDNRRPSLLVSGAAFVVFSLVGISVSFLSIQDQGKPAFLEALRFAFLAMACLLAYGAYRMIWEFRYGALQVYEEGIYVIQWKQPEKFIRNEDVLSFGLVSGGGGDRTPTYVLETPKRPFRIDGGMRRFDQFVKHMEYLARQRR